MNNHNYFTSVQNSLVNLIKQGGVIFITVCLPICLSICLFVSMIKRYKKRGKKSVFFHSLIITCLGEGLHSPSALIIFRLGGFLLTETQGVTRTGTWESLHKPQIPPLTIK